MNSKPLTYGDIVDALTWYQTTTEDQRAIDLAKMQVEIAQLEQENEELRRKLAN